MSPPDGHRRVVLLHGLWMPGAVMHWLALRLQDAGFATETYSYHGIADGPELAAPGLVEFIGDADADIVAHSLGGLVALQALCDAPALPVRRVVCLGSPLAGSGAVSGILRWPPAASLFGRSAELLQHGFPCWEGRAEVGVIAGCVPHGLGALFGHFHGPHDGTVAVEETRLRGLADHVVIDASHSGLLLSEEAAAQTIAFLREGRFRPAAAAAAGAIG
ncbi:MAG TPA: alpha/beta hydrolase [Xanthomonadaceae bacterium]|nr:alpha/beta hydrolase [Xanthomonadaceae bacterium]